MEQSDLNVLVKPLVLERSEDEVRVVVVEVEAEQVLVELRGSNLHKIVSIELC